MAAFVEDSQLHSLARDLAADPKVTMTAVTATTIRAVKNIQRDSKALARAIGTAGHIRKYAGKITTSSKVSALSVEAEVGPLQSGQGALGELLEFGSANNPPHPHLMPAADKEIPVWLRYLRDAAGSGI